MNILEDSSNWAIDFIKKHSDGDLFPRIVEIDALDSYRSDFFKEIIAKDANSLPPGASRRFIVPKDEVSYRQATQLDIQDSVILTSLIYQYGMGIESRRLTKNRVFSYRFNPTTQNDLYDSSISWNDFWEKAKYLSNRHSHVLYCDIADFYNQIYHHPLENQLVKSGFPNQAIKWILNLLSSTTAGVSRGIPIGPHAAHLLAEATLIPIDNSLSLYELNFIRFADDIIVFCTSERDAHSALYKIASVLDKQQRVMLQRHKTKIHTAQKFQELCINMVEDRPINSDEEGLLAIINKYSDGDPYKSISFNEILPSDWELISESTIEGIILEYLSKSNIDFIRLKWFYRRLTQIGHPGAINVSIKNIETLWPCLPHICLYFSSIQSIEPSRWVEIGKDLINLLKINEINQNEFFKLSILNLFSRNASMNHFSTLIENFPSMDQHSRREILLAAKVNYAFDWLRELKESFSNMDPWQKSAYLYCISGLPIDEKSYFIKQFKFTRPVEIILAKWCKATT